ncbi:P-loop containing nucleoside triphosphate hydrolase protein [Mycena alexandri]|uniref:P-loop containing nucleoside triphosphate hydrolase protein n=1 Tax=Mycena alexandri TaxID=1745969 RepID=A0AAD6WTH4_9AGAR|nr:P-loop containing nucleoside triphosphate hydrolase protein [Mycena alexandri]
MSTAVTTTQSRLNNIARCVSSAVDTLELVSNTLKTPFLGAISSTSRSLLIAVETVKQNKEACIRLLDQTHQLLYAIIALHIKSDAGGEFPPSVLSQIGSFTETLHKIHHFVEAQQEKGWLKQFFRQAEMNALLKDCNAGLQQSLDFFQIQALGLVTDAAELQEYARDAHQEVLEMIDSRSDMNAFDRASSINRGLSSSESSSTSISMLPSEPKIFHGRDSELADILSAFGQEPTRIAILGAGGMGKTSLSRAVLHHPQVVARYGLHRVFVACDTAPTKIELAALIGAHLGLKSGRDVTRALIRHFATGPPTLLILDNLETVWDPRESRGEIEEFLSLLTDINHMALIITMRGAERPAKVHWTRPFLAPLLPLSRAAARQTFIDIADEGHDKQDVDKILSLTDNLPLAINLIAHLVDSEGCLTVLSRWEEERTSIISEGFDKKSNLDISISVSLSSPRITSVPRSKDLLSLLSILPDGLADVELRQANIPIDDILRCKTALLRTSLAHQDQGRLKSLVPIREYFQRFHPPPMQLLRPLRLYFHELLDLYVKHRGTLPNRGVTDRIALNFVNIQNVLVSGLTQENPDLVDTIYSVTHLDSFSAGAGRGHLMFIERISDVLPQPTNHRLEVFVITRRLLSWRYHPVADTQALVDEALEHFKHFDDPDLQGEC